MFSVERQKLIDDIGDERIIKYFYLDLDVHQLINRMENLSLSGIGNDENIPFTAKLRDYHGATDEAGDPWLVKEIPKNEIYEHKLQEIAYYIDFMVNTMAAPNVIKKIDGRYYRTTKLVPGALQIGSYNFLQRPFLTVLANDLINRWLFFDEDRNPNNYMVLSNSKGHSFVVVIDYNKADLWSKGMKIKGTESHFGWERKGKTRFLTLLKPDNFKNLSIEDFEERLGALERLEKPEIRGICFKVFTGYIEDPEAAADLVAANLDERRNYITNYFRVWFKEKDLAKSKAEDDRYSGFGKSFMDYYKDGK
ncbi:hypothetical protein [Marispirochaeta sp.]|uniref:hypothetical protein n=1 Tax=Marispirochaeta sp. TaxID=2038653 RepID=UPI0029C7EA03|nr:hypothetical protein [Marispirochaeta sp.]